VVVSRWPALHNQTRPRALAPDRALTVTATSQAQLGVSRDDLTAGGAGLVSGWSKQQDLLNVTGGEPW